MVKLEAAWLAAIIESSDDAIISKDLDGIITSWNKAAESIFGYTAEEVIGQPGALLMPDDRQDEEPEILSRIRKGEKVNHYETERRRKDGSLVNISLSVSPIVDSSGRIVGASKIARDITEQKRAEVDRSRLAAIVEGSDDAIVSKDLSGVITSWNAGAERLFGYLAEEAIGKPITIIIPKGRQGEEPNILSRIRRGERVDHFETVRRRKDGSLLDISLTVSPITDAKGQIIGASKIARNITERKRAERSARDAEILRHVIDAQEAERHKIARDIHDHLGQRMTGLRFQLESLIDSCGSDPKLNAKAEKVRGIASEIDQDIGFLSWELKPTELEHVGLEDALKSFTREWSKQYGIAAEFQTNRSGDALGVRLPRTIETNLYRIVQEGLNNVVKHSGAGKVSVILHLGTEILVLIIEDNGWGFDLAEAQSHGEGVLKGHGLIGMRERAAMFGGSLEVESQPGIGTTILVSMPWEYGSESTV